MHHTHTHVHTRVHLHTHKHTHRHIGMFLRCSQKVYLTNLVYELTLHFLWELDELDEDIKINPKPNRGTFSPTLALLIASPQTHINSY